MAYAPVTESQNCNWIAAAVIYELQQLYSLCRVFLLSQKSAFPSLFIMYIIFCEASARDIAGALQINVGLFWAFQMTACAARILWES